MSKFIHGCRRTCEKPESYRKSSAKLARRSGWRVDACSYTEAEMSEISRRILLAGAASAPLLAQQAARTAAAPAPARDTIPKRRLLSGRSTAESLQKSLVDRAGWKPFPVAAE